MDDDAPQPVPIGDTLDLHTFRPKDVGTLVPDWLTECRAVGILEVRVVHGKGAGALRAGVLALLERSPLVRAIRSDGNWGGVVVHLHDRATDEARVRAILAASPRFVAALGALQRAGPPGAWLGGGAVRNRVWHALHRRPGEPDETDLDVAWVRDPAAEAGPETATGVAARGPELELYAAHGWDDLVGMVVRPIPGFDAEAWRARLAAKRWRQRFPWARIEVD